MKTPTACTVVTKADVEQALGRPVSGGVEHKTAPAQSTCDYTSGDGEITIALVHSGDKLDADEEMRELEKILPKGAVREATGIGLRAFFLDIPRAGAQLHVLRGEHDYLMISVLGLGGPSEVSSAAVQIARKALDRL
ncbi:MAG TPA: hypothetical protein VMB25_23305 [Bryobacteraceae bacterium]|nr:hypothetical protein [Bryobacteraceae bacterium]